MNKIYKVIWSKVRNCYVAVSEIAKRNGKNCTSVNCGTKANRGRVGAVLAIALSLSMVGGGVAWGENRIIEVQNPSPVTSDETNYWCHELIFPSGSGAGTGVNFTVGNGGKIKFVYSENSGNTIKINNGGEVTYSGGGSASYWPANGYFGPGILGGVSNNKVEIAGTVNGAVAGGFSVNSSVSNNSVEIKNTAALKYGYSDTHIYGGYSVNSTAESNEVTFGATDYEGNIVNTGYIVCGGYSKNGSAKTNTVTINGKVPGKVYGGFSNSNGEATGNHVYLNSGEAYSVYGGYTDSTSSSHSANENEVTIQGTVTSDVNGGNAYYGNASSNKVYIKSGASAQKVAGGSAREYGSAETNTVEISGGTVSDIVMGGFSQRGIAGGDTKVKGNTVTISAGSVTNHVYGGYSPNNETNNKAIYNTVEIKGGTIGGASKSIYGGYAGKTAQYNIVTITDGTVTADVYGGYSKNSAALNNSVTIKETGEVTGNVYGGSGSGANYNTVTINGVTVTGDVYGGYNSGSSANNTAYNTVELNGASVNGSITGGTYDKNGNTLFLSGAGNTVTGDINKFATINIADSVAWNSGTTVLSAKKYDDGALSKPQLNITEATGLSGATTYGTMTLLATTNTNTNLSGIKLKYNDGDPVTLSATAATPKLSQVVKASTGLAVGKTNENNGVTFTYDEKEHVVALDSANSYKNVLYKIADNVTGVTFGNMTWGTGRTLETGHHFAFEGAAIDASNLEFAKLEEGALSWFNSPSIKTGTEMSLLANATGITAGNSITQPTTGKGTVSIQLPCAGMFVDATAKGTVSAGSDVVKYVVDEVKVGKLTLGETDWADSYGLSFGNWGWTLASDAVIDATNMTYKKTYTIKKVGDKHSVVGLNVTGTASINNIIMPSSGKVAVPNTVNSDSAITFDATAYGEVIFEDNTVKTKITSVALDKVTLGTYSWGTSKNMPDSSWTASASTTIDDTNFAYTGNANTKLKQNDTAVILNATGLTTSSSVIRDTGASATKTVGMNFTDNGDNGSGFIFVGTVNGHVEAAADKVNYVVDGVTLNNVNLATWTGTAYNIASADNWVLSTGTDNKVNATLDTSSFALPTGMTLATGEKKVIITADGTDYFKDIIITGTNMWKAGDSDSSIPLDSTAVNGVSVTGTQTQGGIKVNELNTSQIIYESSKKNVTGITLGTVPVFTNGGTAARTFDSEHDVSNATITATNLGFADTSPMEAGDTMTIVDATDAITYAASGQTLKDFDTVTYSDVAFTDTITDPTNSSTTDTIAFAGKHTDTLSLNAAKTKLIYTVGDKVVDTATLSGPITWSDGGTYYTNGTAANQKNRNSVFTFNESSTFDISGVKFSTTDDPLAGATKTMTLIGGNTIDSVAKNVAGTITNGTPESFDVSLTKNNTLLAASASGSAAIDSGDLNFTVTGVAIDKINVTSITGDADTVPTGWTLAKDADDKVIATVETDELSVSDPSGLKPGETKVIIEAAAGSTDYFKDVTVNGGYAWKADGSNITSDLDIGGVAITGTQTKGGVKVDDANKSQLIYEETKKTVTGITLGEVTFAKDGTARAFDNTYDATGATINGDNLKFTEASAASMETGDTMTILDASAAFKSGGAALVEFADKSYTVAFSETNTDQNVTIAGTHSDTLSQDAAKTKLTYTVGTKDVNTVALGKVDFVKGSTLFDRSGAGYNYAGVAALGTDGFAVSYASPETVATGDSMTLLQANAKLKDMAEKVKQTSYSFAPVSGVTVDATVTGSLEAKGGNVTYTATANQASKLTFTNVNWKDSGALMTRPSNITFAGADVDTAKIHFQNVKELDANKKMTLVSDFGDSVGTITGTKYTVGAGLEGEGAASLSGSDLIFTTKTGARDLAALAQTHNTLMVMEAGMAVLAAGREHLGQAMVRLADPQNAGSDGTRIGASMGGGWSRYKTGSHVDSNNWNVAVALGSKRELKKGSLEWGVFGEYGKSNYTLHSDAGRGDGDSHYAGGGLMAKWTNKHDVYTEASVRLGRLSDTASNLLRDAAGNSYGYDVHANYFGAHVGIGKIIRYNGGKSLDVYGKYFYTKRDGVDFTSGGNNYSLDSVASSILRVGARYGTTDKKWNWYGGLAYEYEFDGKSEGTVDGVGIRAASVKGGSVRGEIGVRMSATKTNPWQTDISIYGYGGKHRGFGGSVNVAYMF